MSEKGDQLRQRMLRTFEQGMRRHGCPPTIRELARALGIKSTNTVAYHLAVLKEQGLLTHTPGAARGHLLARPPGVPILGTIAAGVPLTIYDLDQCEILDLGQHLRGSDDSSEVGAKGAEFALRVKGDSMIEDHIFDGDFVLVRPATDAPNGAIVVAVHLLAGGELGAATVKRFHRDRNRRMVRLEPANAAKTPFLIPASEWDREWAIQGTVTGVYRPFLA